MTYQLLYWKQSLLRTLYARFKLRGIGRTMMWLARHVKSLQMLPVPTCDGRILYLDLREYSCIPYLLTGEVPYEKNDSDIVGAIVRPGDTAIDIGANVGWYTTLLAECVGQFGKVYAFEPNENVYRLLMETAKDYPQVQAIHAGLSSNQGEYWLYVPKDSGQASLRPLFPPKHIQKCRLLTLDSFLEQEGLYDVKFIKCDVEGSELSVLLGAERLLNSNKPPMWMIEVNAEASSQFGYQPNRLLEIFRSVQQARYRSYVLDRRTGKLQPLSELLDPPIFNLFVVPGWLEDRLPYDSRS